MTPLLGSAAMKPLRLISYLAPSIPEGLFRLIAGTLESELGVPVTLEFETRVSGPSPDSDPFAEGRAEIAFVESGQADAAAILAGH